MAKNTLFDVLKNISGTNNNRWLELQSVYNPYMINKFLSMHPETVFFANEMNKSKLTPREQYEFYINVIPNKYRHFKYIKNNKDGTIDLVANHFKVNKDIARQYISILDDKHIKRIEQKADTGGRFR